MSSAIVQCFFDAVAALRDDLRARGSDLAVLCGDPAEELVRLARKIGAKTLFFAEDYEPYARVRDAAVSAALEKNGVEVRRHLDHVYFGSDEIVRAGGAPYKMFAPYRRQRMAALWERPRAIAPSLRRLRGKLLDAAAIGETQPVPAPERFGFTSSTRYPRCSERAAHALLARFARDGLEDYGKRRDFPSLDATSHLSPQLRAGTIGIRTCVEAAKGGPAWLNELV